ncbi:MAG: YhcH/YjgK/YiaL family protein [bacterium]
MIVDKIENIEFYKNINPKIAKALDYIENTDFSKVQNGRYEIEGLDIFAIVQEYDSKPIENGKLEAHKIYTDIQFIAEGSEKIGYDSIENLTVSEEYNQEKDLMFYEEKGELITLNKNMFAIFFPHDAHMPGISTDKPNKVKKVVVKIKL